MKATAIVAVVFSFAKFQKSMFFRLSCWYVQKIELFKTKCAIMIIQDKTLLRFIGVIFIMDTAPIFLQ